MKVLITSGGTIEHVDEIRVLTNISTGKLGAKIANTIFISPTIEKIYYICSKGTVLPLDVSKVIEVIYANSAQEVYEIMEKLVPQVDAVIHLMAVSDFGFKPSNIKLKSDNPDAFIDSLRDRIFINPKILSFIKKWNPKVILISFKFEVNKTHEELIDIAYESLKRNNSDFVVANDKQEMKKKNQHIAYIIDKDKNITNCFDKIDIAQEIYNKLKLK